MQVEVGSILEGKVSDITKFGAFVELPNGKTGMVHISEIDTKYVKEISDHLKQDQVVKVKVLGVTPEGKISLSIRRCLEPDSADSPARSSSASSPRPASSSFRPREQQPRSGGAKGGQNRPWQPKRAQPLSEMNFEDMLNKFKQTSEDKMSDIKRSTGETRRSRKGQSK